MSFGGILRQSTAVDVLIGPFVDSTDGDAEESGLTIAQADVRLSKNGQTGAQKNDNTTCAHDADGFYNCELDATDTNTVGQLTLYVHVAGALCVRHDYQVIEEATYDIMFAASATGAVPVASIANDAITAAAIATGAIDADAIADNAIDAGAIAADAITAAKIANGAIDAATFAADVDAEILSYLVDDATRIDASSLNTASVTTIPAILVDTAEIGAAGAGLTAINLPDQTMNITGNITGNLSGSVGSVTGAVGSVTGNVGGNVAGSVASVTGLTASDVGAIKTKTDQLTFTVANKVDANITHVIGDPVQENGASDTNWGGTP